MYLFTARYRNQVQSIIVHKDLKVHEFLEALSYSLQLPDGVIVGFQDRSGLIVTPSFICLNPQEIKNEQYDVMLKSQNQSFVSQQSIGQAFSQGHQNLSNSQTSTLLLDTSGQQHQIIPNRQQQTSSFYDNFSQHQQQPPLYGGILPTHNNSHQHSRTYGQSAGNSMQNERTVLMGASNSYQFSNISSNQTQEGDLILFVNSLQTDTLLTDSVKSKIIQKARYRDSRIIGAYQLYLVDGDIESFKARVIHRVITPPSDYSSSATTAQFNWTASRQSTSGGFRPQTREHSRMRGGNLGGASQQVQQNLTSSHHSTQNPPQVTQPAAQDRYLPVILELENKGMVDEQCASLLKTLVLEENVEVFRVINSYIAKNISDRELGFKLARLAQKLSNYIERPQSPLPRKKNQLLNYVNSLARYHFSDPDDVQLLNKLIQEENEFILSCFDVFESDKDHDNLIDSLNRILEKSKAMGLHINSMTASSFYNQNPWRSNQHTPIQQPNNQSYSQSSIRQAQPYISKWEERGHLQQQQQLQNNSGLNGQSHFANQSNIARSSERPHGAIGGRRNMNTSQAAAPRNQPPPPTQFQNTTVHNVALIPNYFSSGEEEGPYFQQQITHQQMQHHQLPPQQQRQARTNNSQQINQHNFYGQREYEVKEELSDDMSRAEIESQSQKQNRGQHKSKARDQKAARQDEDSESQIVAQNKRNDDRKQKEKSKARNIPKSSQKSTKDSKKKKVVSSSSSDSDSDDSDKKKTKSKKKSKNQGKSKKRHSSSDSSSDSSSSDSDQSEKYNKQRGKSSKRKPTTPKQSKKKSDQKLTKDELKSTKKSKKAKAPQISQQEIENILDEEEIEKVLRPENFAILAYLLSLKDQELVDSFIKYSQDDDSEYLISSLESKTEDTLQYLLMQKFSNEDNAKIRSLRSQRNDGIRRAFKKFKRTLDLEKLVSSIRKVIEEHTQSTGILQNSAEKVRVIKQQSRKDKLESIYNMVYHAEFNKEEKVSQVIQKQFHQIQDPELLDILEDYQRHNNYLELKNQVQDYLKNYIRDYKQIEMEPELPLTIKDAINLLLMRGDIGVNDQKMLQDLYKVGDRHLLAAWEAFQVIKKMDDFVDTLLILCEVKKEEAKNQSKKNQVSQSQPAVSHQQVQNQPTSLKSFESNAIQNQKQTIASSNQKSQESVPQLQLQAQPFSLFGSRPPVQQTVQNQVPTPSYNQAQQPSYDQHQSSAAEKVKETDQLDENLQIEDNPDDVKLQHPINLLQSDNEDIQSIIEYQHKILRKYCMMGMIQYADAPLFHDMVDQRDYKMISIFEVFAINRNGEDFLENLGLFAQLVMEQEGVEDQNQLIDQKADEVEEISQEDELDLTNPKIQVLNQVRGQLTEQEFKWVVQAVNDNLKNINTIIQVFTMMKDMNDLVHSIKKLYSKSVGQ
ncbi:UNKNOWN [Stylonychia lemnae]|uniref:Uncharacterized protein n=1 Tax=Stylonychia lemnae TaxID=5949 RepID=A0A077ZSS5_STYLE|nr:UNKNOWN [Stylonychia lemnae]|eukprot:CDW71526.1 UNKNOWN [Stylonychia lemnae]